MRTAAPNPGSGVVRASAPRADDPPSSEVFLASFPFIRENPYQELLYRQLATHGFAVAEDGEFKLRWLVRRRDEVKVLHFHWPRDYYGWWRRPARLRYVLSWLKLGVFACRLVAARVLGYTIVWTIHEVFPHERLGRGVDRAGGKLLARASDLIIAHDRGTAERSAAELGVRPSAVRIVPHASYIGVYPERRSRAAVRHELAIPADDFAFLCFGHVRAYKALDLLLDAFSLIREPRAALIIAGLPLDEASADAVRAAQAHDHRIKSILTFVPDDGVAELYAASDVAVLPRSDGGTSGALMLALSMGRAAIAARLTDYAEVMGGEESGWLFEPGDAASLAAAMRTALDNPDEAQARGAAGRRRAGRATWDSAGAETAKLIELASRHQRTTERSKST
jgi:glycosyltransferase involved in cell wall biosynthesis